MKVLVCGGRDFVGYVLMSDVLKQWDIRMVIHGGGRGADNLAGHWAHEHAVPEVIVPAQWHNYGRRAGPVRNSWMLALDPDLVVAFPGGKGTADMVRQARSAGVEVYDVSVNR